MVEEPKVQEVLQIGWGTYVRLRGLLRILNTLNIITRMDAVEALDQTSTVWEEGTYEIIV